MKNFQLTCLLFFLGVNFAQAQYKKIKLVEDKNIKVELLVKKKITAFDTAGLVIGIKNKLGERIQVNDFTLKMPYKSKRKPTDYNILKNFQNNFNNFKSWQFFPLERFIIVEPNLSRVAYHRFLTIEDEAKYDFNFWIELTYKVRSQEFKLVGKPKQQRIKTYGITKLTDEQKRDTFMTYLNNPEKFEFSFYSHVSHHLELLPDTTLVNYMKREKSTFLRHDIQEYALHRDKDLKDELIKYYIDKIVQDKLDYSEIFNFWDDSFLLPLINKADTLGMKFLCSFHIIQQNRKLNKVKSDSLINHLMYQVVKKNEAELFKNVKTRKDTIAFLPFWFNIIESTRANAFKPFLTVLLNDTTTLKQSGISVKGNNASAEQDNVSSFIQGNCNFNGSFQIMPFADHDVSTIGEHALNQILKIEGTSYQKELDDIKRSLYEKEFKQKFPNHLEIAITYGFPPINKYLEQAKKILWEREIKRLLSTNQ